MVFTPLSLLVVIRMSPFRPNNRLLRKLVKCLSNKLRTSKSPVYPLALSASLGHRCYAIELLNLLGRFIPSPIRTHSRQQSWRQRAAGARKVIEQLVVRMLFEHSRDLLVELLNCSKHARQLTHDRLDYHCRGFDHCLVPSERITCTDLFYSLLNHILVPGAMLAIELLELGPLRALYGFKRGPFL